MCYMCGRQSPVHACACMEAHEPGLSDAPGVQLRGLWAHCPAAKSKRVQGRGKSRNEVAVCMLPLPMLQVTRAQFVDARGQQHEVDPLEVDAAFLDPLGALRLTPWT